MRRIAAALGKQPMRTKRRLYAQIWRDIARLKELQDAADADDEDAIVAFHQTHGAVDVRRIFLNALESDGKKKRSD